jgi:hypothetical protein
MFIYWYAFIVKQQILYDLMMSVVILHSHPNILGRLNYHREISALTTNDKAIFLLDI